MASNSVFRQFLLDVFGLVGGIAEAQAADAGTIAELTAESFRGKQAVPLTPSEAAVAYLKGVLPFDVAANEAALGGVDGSRFRNMADFTGNPPGPQELLDRWRKGDIDDATLERGIRQGFIRDEWLPFYKRQFTLPLSTAEVVEGVVQNQIPYDVAQAVAKGNAVANDDFDALVRIAGNPPGPQEMLTMWRRGIIDQATMVQGLKESRLKDKYIPAFLQLYRARIPLRTITTLLNANAITEQQATNDLEALGYTAEDAAALIAAHKKAGGATHKQLSAAKVIDAYEARVIARDKAVADLGLAGYDPAVAGELLDLADAQAVAKLRAAAVTKIRAIYVAHRMTRAEASADLDKLLVPADQRDHMLDLWDLEQQANIRTLSEAELRLIAKATGPDGTTPLVPAGWYVGRLVAMGYTHADASLLAAAHQVP